KRERERKREREKRREKLFHIPGEALSFERRKTERQTFSVHSRRGLLARRRGQTIRGHHRCRAGLVGGGGHCWRIGRSLALKIPHLRRFIIIIIIFKHERSADERKGMKEKEGKRRKKNTRLLKGCSASYARFCERSRR